MQTEGLLTSFTLFFDFVGMLCFTLYLIRAKTTCVSTDCVICGKMLCSGLELASFFFLIQWLM